MDCDNNESTKLIMNSVQPAPGSYASVLKGREKDRMSGNKIKVEENLLICFIFLVFHIFIFIFLISLNKVENAKTNTDNQKFIQTK